MSGAGTAERTRGIVPPTGTWVSMLLALVLTLLLSPLTNLVFEYPGNQTLWPLALIATIIALDLVGAVFALRRRRYGWAVVSALWGPFLLQAGFVITVMV